MSNKRKYGLYKRKIFMKNNHFKENNAEKIFINAVIFGICRDLRKRPPENMIN